MALGSSCDQGWAWVVLLSSFLCNLIIDGFVYSYGVIMLELLQYYEAGRGVTAWTGSLCNGIQGLVGPFGSILINRFGCRWTMIIGCLIAACGMLLSPHAPSIWVMSLSFGVMTGIGFGLMHLCPFVVIGQYFEKRRSLATGIATCGSGVGTIVFPSITPYLISIYNWSGTMWILAGIALNGLVIGFSYFKQYTPSKRKDKKKKKILEFGVLQRASHLSHMCATFCGLTGFFIVFMFLPDLGQTRHFDPQKCGFLLSICGMSSTLTRILVGWASDFKEVDPLRLYNCFLAIGAVVVFSLGWVHTYQTMAACAAVVGMSMGALVTLMPLIVMDIEGVDLISDCFGFLSISAGSAALLGGPLAGVIHDSTGSHTISFCVAGSLIGFASLISIPMHHLQPIQISCCQSDQGKTKSSDGEISNLLTAKCHSIQNEKQQDNIPV